MRGVLGDVEFAFSAGAGWCSSDLGTFAALVCISSTFVYAKTPTRRRSRYGDTIIRREGRLDHVTSSCECIEERVRLRDVVGIRIPDERAGV